eukprot:TRINITY_DN5692_c0_g1_i1.p1 TRINITY_DN5692_c0_g1~~TRINITY_DN5692_c0_g1_i1.p1  ORF type:complete len:131 (+),score=43.37 TRINITY_DN5692_c0_g1_i1:236-628(+)
MGLRLQENEVVVKKIEVADGLAEMRLQELHDVEMKQMDEVSNTADASPEDVVNLASQNVPPAEEMRTEPAEVIVVEEEEAGDEEAPESVDIDLAAVRKWEEGENNHANSAFKRKEKNCWWSRTQTTFQSS